MLVQRALDSVHGVDLNPYAVAIARFRLLARGDEGVRDHAAERCAGVRHSPRLRRFAAARQRSAAISRRSDVADELDHVYQPEDPDALARLLQPGTYHAVVANPPYITPKDTALNDGLPRAVLDLPHDSIAGGAVPGADRFARGATGASPGRSRPTAS